MNEPHIYVPEVAELFPPQGLWTEADYLRLPHNTRTMELFSGRLVIHPPQTATHQRVAGELAIAMDRFVDEHKLGEVLFASVAVRLGLNQIRMPDVLYLAKPNVGRKRKLWVEGPPDLIVEVVSSTSRTIDAFDKLADYARAFVSEYWLVDPDEQGLRVFSLDTSGDSPEYRLAGSYGPGTIAKSALLSGFEIPLSQLF